MNIVLLFFPHTHTFVLLHLLRWLVKDERTQQDDKDEDEDEGATRRGCFLFPFTHFFSPFLVLASFYIATNNRELRTGGIIVWPIYELMQGLLCSQVKMDVFFFLPSFASFLGARGRTGSRLLDLWHWMGNGIGGICLVDKGG